METCLCSPSPTSKPASNYQIFMKLPFCHKNQLIKRWWCCLCPYKKLQPPTFSCTKKRQAKQPPLLEISRKVIANILYCGCLLSILMWKKKYSKIYKNNKKRNEKSNHKSSSTILIQIWLIASLTWPANRNRRL